MKLLITLLLRRDLRSWLTITCNVIVLSFFIVVLPAKESNAGIVPVERVRVVSHRHAKEACKDFAIFWRQMFRCSGKPEDYGWWGRHCHRRSTVQYNNVICEQDFFVTNPLNRQVDCERNAEYIATNGGTPRLTRTRWSATTKWKCRMNAQASRY